MRQGWQTNGFCESLPGANYTEEETLVLKAADEYRRRKKLRFLGVIDVLNVLRGLGYTSSRPAIIATTIETEVVVVPPEKDAEAQLRELCRRIRFEPSHK